LRSRNSARAAALCAQCFLQQMISGVGITFDSYKPEMGTHGKLNLQYPASHNDGKAKAKGNGASIHRIVMQSRLEFERVKELLAEQPGVRRKFNIAQVCVLIRPDNSVAAMLLRCAEPVQPGVIFKWFRDELQQNIEQTKQLVDISKISTIHKGGKDAGKTEWYSVCLQYMKDQSQDAQKYFNADYASGDSAFFEWSFSTRHFNLRYALHLVSI
jgi:hypothetical protein